MLILLCFYSKIDLKLWNFQKIRSKTAREAKYGNIWQYTPVFSPKFEHAQEAAQSTAKSSSTQAKTPQNHPKDAKNSATKPKSPRKILKTRQKLGSKTKITMRKASKPLKRLYMNALSPKNLA